MFQKLLFSIAVLFFIAAPAHAFENIAPTEITPGSTGWQDVDVTAYVGADAGSVAGVFVYVVNNSTSEYSWNIRNNGSTDAIEGTGASDDILEDTSGTIAAVGVDGNDIFEIYFENVTAQDLYIIGYTTTDESTFFTNRTDLGLMNTSDWADVDISSATGGDTAKIAYLTVREEGRGAGWAIRENGSTDSFNVVESEAGYDGFVGGMVSVDANEIFEASSRISTRMFLQGYTDTNVTTYANKKAYPTGTTGSYVDTDVSTDVPSGSVTAFYYVSYTSTGQEGLLWVRPDGATTDLYWDTIKPGRFGIVDVESSQVIEQKIESTVMDLYIWAVTPEVSAPEGRRIIITG